MVERNSDGRFGSEVKEYPHRFKKGQPRPANAGRKKGTPNKITREVKEWLAALVAKADVQDAVEERIKRGDAVAFFRALDQVIGKPVERSNVTLSGQVDSKIEVVWKGKA